MTSNFRLVSSGIDVSELIKDLNAYPHLWDRHTQRQDTKGSCHTETKTIFLRWSKELSVHTVFTDLVAVDYPELDLLPSARSVIAEVIKKTKSTHLARVILVKLQAFGEIPQHIDGGLYAETFERFHLCLTSSLGNRFYNEKESVRMQPGQIWHFNHEKPHRVENRSEEPRIHMIVDTISEKYRSLRLKQSYENQQSEVYA